MKTPLLSVLYAFAFSLQCAGAPAFAKGADLSWATGLEKRGYTWKNADGKPMEIFALMKSLGFNSVRLRVWVNPKDGSCTGEDLLEKARRAARLRMNVMVDFHYSDSWADPGKQFKPAAWKNMDRDSLAKAVYSHTAETLKAVKSTGAVISWVQVGNEIRPGLLWDVDGTKSGALRSVEKDGKLLAAENRENFALFLNAGAKAVRKVCPLAKVVVHSDHGERWGDIHGVLEAAKSVDYDIFGVSVYPKEDWGAAIASLAANLERVKAEYGKNTMVCEFGMPTYPFDPARDATRAILKALRRVKGCKGLFWWEPEAFPETHYDKGAMVLDGKSASPAPALLEFRGH